jgi:photosystem II stability/assembly factor-like uncharacterized protein
MATSIFDVATDEGVVVLESKDGESWSVAHRGLENWSVSQVAVAPSAPNRAFAGTRGDGVWLSEDFGKSWKKPCYGKAGPGKVKSVAIDPYDEDTVYAGAEPIDVFVSHDAAGSWKRLESVWKVPYVASVTYPVPTVEPHIRDIALDPTQRDTLYVALQVGYILKSTDGGSSWKLLDKGLDADVHKIVINPENPKQLFIATGGHDCRKGSATGRALYTSNNAGETWEPTAVDITEEYSVPLVMHPRDPKILFSAVANGQPGQWRGRETGAESAIIRTTDGGRHWEKIDGSLSNASKDFAEAIVIDDVEPDHIYAAFRGGELYASKDSGNSWRRVDVKVPLVSDMRGVHA